MQISPASFDTLKGLFCGNFKNLATFAFVTAKKNGILIQQQQKKLPLIGAIQDGRATFFLSKP